MALLIFISIILLSIVSIYGKKYVAIAAALVGFMMFFAVLAGWWTP
jgi:hypothetical protein